MNIIERCVMYCSPVICVEVGCGSGAVSAFIANILGPNTLYLLVIIMLTLRLSVCLSVLPIFSVCYVSVCLIFCLSVLLPVCLSVSLSVLPALCLYPCVVFECYCFVDCIMYYTAILLQNNELALGPTLSTECGRTLSFQFHFDQLVIIVYRF